MVGGSSPSTPATFSIILVIGKTMSMLNEFQLAVLNEMGLTVFVSSDNGKFQDTLPTASNDSNNRRSTSNKISALRETLIKNSGENTDSASPNTTHINQSPNKPKPRPVDIENKALIGDIHLALASLNLPTPDEKNWLVSDSKELTLNDQFMALPFNVKALLAEDKKHLWRQLLQVQISLSP